MKRWLLMMVTVILLGVYSTFLLFWYREPSHRTMPADPSLAMQATTVTTIPQTTSSAVNTSESTVPATPPEIPPLSARHAFVYHCETGRLLYALGDQQAQVAPASLTKLFTAYVALRYLDVEDVVTVGEEVTWIHPHSSVASVLPGTRTTVKMLIQGMMMQSGNDAAYALATAAGRAICHSPAAAPKEAYDAFIREANRLAEELGLSGTHLQNPDGIDAEKHYTTPADLIQIALLAMEEPIICTYANVDRDYVMYESGEDYTYRSTNWLLHPDSEYYCEAAFGLKTGSTSKAGNCLLALFHCDDGTLLVGVLGCPTYQDRFADALALYHAYK